MDDGFQVRKVSEIQESVAIRLSMHKPQAGQSYQIQLTRVGSCFRSPNTLWSLTRAFLMPSAVFACQEGGFGKL